MYPSVGIFHIYVIEAGTPQSNYLYSHSCQLVYNRFINCVVYKYAHAVIPLGKLSGVLVQLGFKKLKIYTVSFSPFFKGRAVIRLGIKKCYFDFFENLLAFLDLL